MSGTPTRRVRFSADAKADLRGIGECIARTLRSPTSADRQARRIRDAAESLGTMPMRHPLVDADPLASLSLRRLIVDRYAIYYLVDERRREVSIARIVHGGRSPEGLFRELA